MYRLASAAVAVVLAFAVLGSSGCASDPGPAARSADTTTTTPTPTTRPGPTFEEWQESTSAVCAEYEPQQDTIAARHGSAATFDDVAALIEELTPVVTRYIDALNAIEPSNERIDDIRRTYELNTELGETAALALTAARAQDETGLRFAVSELESLGAQLKALLQALDLPACISE